MAKPVDKPTKTPTPIAVYERYLLFQNEINEVIAKQQAALS